MIKVSITRVLDDPDDDGRSTVEVYGRATPLRADGQPKHDVRPYLHPLPAELGAPLLGLAATH